MNKIANTPLAKRNKEHWRTLKVANILNKGLTNERNMETHRYHEIAKEHECQNLGGTPVEKRCKT